MESHFSGRVCMSRCSHCFSPSHLSACFSLPNMQALQQTCHQLPPDQRQQSLFHSTHTQQTHGRFVYYSASPSHSLFWSHTPAWSKALQACPLHDQHLAKFFISDIVIAWCKVFALVITNTWHPLYIIKSAWKNFQGTDLHPSVVKGYDTEACNHCVAGYFPINYILVSFQNTTKSINGDWLLICLTLNITT